MRVARGLLVFSALSDGKAAAEHAASNASSLATPCRAWPFCHPSNRAAMLELEGKSYRLKEAAARIALTPVTA